MDDAARDMIYHFCHRAPEEGELPYKRGVCRIWPIDEFDWYMDPAPNEPQGTFSILPKEEIREVKELPNSAFIDAITKKLKELEIGDAKKFRKGSRKYIANHAGIKKWRIGYKLKCARYEKN